MPFDPSEFVLIAKSLPSNLQVPKEGRTRSAIGRAYYALFLATRAAVCVAVNKHVDHGVAHGDLTAHLYAAASASGDPKLAATAKTLEELYAARRQADYKLEPDTHWAKNLTKPAFAEGLVTRSAVAIGKLAAIDFSPMVGRL